MNFDRKLVVKEMIKKSLSSYNIATVSFDLEELESCISRLYYSAFQCILALMISREVPISTRKSVRVYLNKVLVIEENFPIRLSKMYNTLMDLRHIADYGVGAEFSMTEVLRYLEEVQEFNREILNRIELDSLDRMDLFNAGL